jgi:hypothetical protein
MQEAEISFTPKPIQLFHQGFKRSDPEHPNALCSQVAEDRLVSYS